MNTPSESPGKVRPPTLAESLRLGVASAHANRVPAILLQVFAGGLVGSYYFVPGVREALAGFEAWRTQLGLLFAFVSTAFFGGLLPWVYQRLVLPLGLRPTLRVGAVLVLFWGLRGVDVSLLYSLQSHWFGDGGGVRTTAIKVFNDLFVICPIYSIPVTALVYGWIAAGLSWQEFRKDLGNSWYRRRAMPMLVSNFIIWIPTCSLIYSLPLPLQIPLFNLVLCFFTLMLTHISRGAQGMETQRCVADQRRNS